MTDFEKFCALLTEIGCEYYSNTLRGSDGTLLPSIEIKSESMCRNGGSVFIDFNSDGSFEGFDSWI